MSLTVSQVLASRPEAMSDTANGVGAQVTAVEQQMDDARGRLDRLGQAWTGAASEAAKSGGTAIVDDHAHYAETLRTLQRTLASGGQEMTEIRSNLQKSVESAAASGWVINDSGQATPGPQLRTLAAMSPATAIQLQLLSLQVSNAIKMDLAQFQAADEKTADALRKLGVDAPPPAAPAPPPPPPPPPASKNPADIAKDYLGRNASDLKKSGELPMDPSIPSDICCANFVTATLQKAGLIDWHSNGVADMSQRLQAQGWHAVPASEAKPGDVAVINGSQHTELVSGNANGAVTLIGSNNINADGTQQISYGHPYGQIVYLSPP